MTRIREEEEVVAITIVSSHFAYPQRVGQAELVLVVG